MSPSTPKKSLLDLPPEIRLEILDIIFFNFRLEAIGATTWLMSDTTPWRSQPILHTCHALRAEGLHMWFRHESSVHFRIQKFDCTAMVRHRAWHDEVRRYYGIAEKQIMFYVAWGVEREDVAVARENLWDWLGEYYVRDLPSTFMEKEYMAAVEKMEVRMLQAVWQPDGTWLDQTMFVSENST